jgi:hypothetical protein
MEPDYLLNVVKESARFESCVAKLYLHLSRTFAEDRDFWLQLYTEEKNHSAIFAAFAIGELPLSLLPHEVIDTDLARIKSNIAIVEQALTGFNAKYDTKLKAYEFALEIEQLAGEAIFQEGLSKESDSEALFFIQRINKDDFDHRKRIEEVFNKIKIKRRILK